MRFNPLSAIGLDLTGADLIYDRIVSGKTLFIPIYTQYIVAEELDVIGDIEVEGTLVVI